jgi:hypothetical protein
MNNISCHLIGLNPYNKKELVDTIPKTIFNVIDLDTINMEILKTPEIDKMYKQYTKLKEDKNDKFKEVDKKMSTYWETNFIDMIQDQVKPKKINILIGQNNHYKSLAKRVPIECTNRFIIKSSDDDIKALIKYNLETYQEDIINGSYPLEYIDYKQLQKKRNILDTMYKKIGYIEKTTDQVKMMLDLLEKTRNTKGSELWISMKEPYNVNSLIHPKNNSMITAYNDPTNAILSSMNINSNIDELQTLKISNPKKLKTRRFVYMVDSKSFISEDNNKFFSQIPVKILAKQKIDSVYDFLINDKLK